MIALSCLNLKEAINCLLPCFIVAGDFALKVQPDVRRSQKPGEATAFSQALTDADMAIQNYFEVVLLAKFPSWGFFGEEESRNSVYFANYAAEQLGGGATKGSRSAEYVFTLDPINHTLPFQDGSACFDIVLSVSRAGRIVAGLTYLPALGEFYLGLEGAGLFTTSREEVQSGTSWRPYSLPEASPRVMVYNDPAQKARLREEFDVIDLVADYKPQGWSTSINDILRGTLSAYARAQASIIDWGAIACIVQAGGGCVSDFSGAPIPSYWDFDDCKVPSLLVSINETVHERVLSCLSGGLRSRKKSSLS